MATPNIDNSSLGLSYQGYPHFKHVFDFERNHDMVYRTNWMRENWTISIYIAAFYLTSVYLLRQYMTNRKPYNIRPFIVVWNLGLAVFSTWGMYRAVPEIYYVLANYGWKVSICNSTCNNITAFWAWAFVFSKVLELAETYFIVLVKRKLIPLQIIHHTVVVVGSWFCFRFHPSVSRWAVTVNYCIHAVMYTYFALKTSNVYLPNFVSKLITLAQIIQMVVGFAVSFFCLWFIVNGIPCNTPWYLALLGVGTYSWFFYLFVDFFYKRYQIKDRRAKIE